jgi:hypothetical protein
VPRRTPLALISPPGPDKHARPPGGSLEHCADRSPRARTRVRGRARPRARAFRRLVARRGRSPPDQREPGCSATRSGTPPLTRSGRWPRNAAMASPAPRFGTSSAATKKAREIDRALTARVDAGPLARQERRDGAGRPAEIWIPPATQPELTGGSAGVWSDRGVDWPQRVRYGPSSGSNIARGDATRWTGPAGGAAG